MGKVQTEVQRRVESQMRVAEEQADFYVRRYAKYIDNAAEVYEEVKGRKMPGSMRRNLAQCLENTRELVEKQRFMEQTYASDISFTNYAFDIVSVVIPSLIAEEIVSVQAMDRRIAQIFFMNILVDKAKGSHAVGDTIMSSKTGWVANRDFSTTKILNESLGKQASKGTATTLSGTLVYFPLLGGTTVTVASTTTAGTSVTATGTVGVGSPINPNATGYSPGSGTVTVAGTLGSGTVTAAGGVYSIVTLKSASGGPGSGIAVTITYYVSLEKTTGAIGKVKVVLNTNTITADTLKLNTEWLMDSAYDLMKAHGRDAEKEILIAMTGEVKAEIDQLIIRDLIDNATATAVSWTATPPTTSQPWIWYKNTVIDAFQKASNNIFAATKRAIGNFAVIGTTFAQVIQSLDQFKAENIGSSDIAGAYFAGVLANKWKIYISPDIGVSEGVMGYIGDTYLKSGYVYAPYIPLFTTPTYTTLDFVSHKGLGSSFGRYMINPKMYVKLTQTGTFPY